MDVSQESPSAIAVLDNNNSSSNNNNKDSANSSIAPPSSVVVASKKSGLPESDQIDSTEDLNRDPTIHIVEPDEEAEMWERVNERKISATLPPRPPRGSVPQAVSELINDRHCCRGLV